MPGSLELGCGAAETYAVLLTRTVFIFEVLGGLVSALAVDLSRSAASINARAMQPVRLVA